MSPMISRPLTIEIALLGYLGSGPQHGYQIHQRLLEPGGLGRIWWLKQAQLYALLGKLEDAGYLTASIQPQETRPARRMFHLTSEGRQAFHAWLTSPVERPRQMRHEFQAKLYFAQQAGSQGCMELIDMQRQVCLKWMEAHAASAEKDGVGTPHLWLMDQFRVGQIQAMLDWLELCREKLK